jgi:hypothetical protein
VLIAIDPGVKMLGVARFNDAGECIYAHVLRVKSLWSVRLDLHCLSAPEEHCVVECPQVYQAKFSKGDPNDLVNVALVAGACASAFVSVDIVRPHEWKGNIPKAVHHRRVMRDAPEFVQRSIAAIKQTTLRHNAIDAYALGLWYLERKNK